MSIALFLTILSLNADFIIEKEFESVTCGSWIKLAHKKTGYRLHSHDVAYGTGSGQQSVTGFSKGDDSNSYFNIQAGHGYAECSKGTPVKCGDIVRLFHQNTQKFLHSHANIASPISNNQEVSAHGKQDVNDNWRIVCKGTWKRDEPVQLEHLETKRFLSTSSRYVFQNVITGQLEVSAVKYASDNEYWMAQEGIYISSE